MKKCLVLFCFLGLALAAFSQGDDYEWIRKIKNAKGHVTMLEFDSLWIIVPEDNSSGRYFSKQLPDELKKEGLKISFCGMVGKIPPNVRMIATPLKLTCVCIKKSEQKKFGLKKRSYKF